MGVNPNWGTKYTWDTINLWLSTNNSVYLNTVQVHVVSVLFSNPVCRLSTSTILYKYYPVIDYDEY